MEFVDSYVRGYHVYQEIWTPVSVCACVCVCEASEDCIVWRTEE